MRNAALQYVRKVAGFTRPSQANAAAFDEAVEAVADATRRLVGRLVTSAPPRTREAEQARARERWQRRASRARARRFPLTGPVRGRMSRTARPRRETGGLPCHGRCPLP